MSDDTGTGAAGGTGVAGIQDGSQPSGGTGNAADSTGNGSNALVLDWPTHIPKELAQEKVWEQFKGKPIDEVLKQVVSLNKYNVGAIKLPDEKDPERGKKLGEIYGKLGRPADPTGYKAEVALPDGVQLSEQHEQGFRQAAHAMGLSNAQYEGVMKFYANYLGEAMQGQAQVVGQSKEEGEKALKDAWGVNYQKNLGLAQRGLGQLAKDALGEEAESFIAEVNGTPLANNPRFLRILAKLGADMQEDGLITGEPESGYNRDAIEAKIAEKKADKAYWNERDPRHVVLIKEVDQLYQQLHNPVFAGR